MPLLLWCTYTSVNRLPDYQKCYKVMESQSEKACLASVHNLHKQDIYETKYSRRDQMKFVEDGL